MQMLTMHIFVINGDFNVTIQKMIGGIRLTFS